MTPADVHRPAPILQAVAAMTAWTDANGDRADFRALDLVLGDLSVHGRDDLIRGLISLAGGLLYVRESEVGPGPLRTLQTFAAAVVGSDEPLRVADLDPVEEV